MTPNLWATTCHLAGLLGYVTGGIGGVLGPLVVWLVKKDTLPEVATHGKEAVNFNLTIAAMELAIVLFVGLTMSFQAIWNAIFAIVIISIVHVAATIRAALRAHRGLAYRYPFGFRFVR